MLAAGEMCIGRNDTGGTFRLAAGGETKDGGGGTKKAVGGTKDGRGETKDGGGETKGDGGSIPRTGAAPRWGGGVATGG